MKVVTFSIFRGGTAKTTSTVNTAMALADRGKKVLVIDLDQQASAGSGSLLRAGPAGWKLFRRCREGDHRHTDQATDQSPGAIELGPATVRSSEWPPDSASQSRRCCEGSAG